VLWLQLFLSYASREMCVQTLNSSFISREKTGIPPSSLLIGQDSTMWGIVSVSPHTHNSDDDRPHWATSSDRMHSGYSLVI